MIDTYSSICPCSFVLALLSPSKATEPSLPPMLLTHVSKPSGSPRRRESSSISPLTAIAKTLLIVLNPRCRRLLFLRVLAIPSKLKSLQAYRDDPVVGSWCLACWVKYPTREARFFGDNRTDVPNALAPVISRKGARHTFILGGATGSKYIRQY